MLIGDKAGEGAPGGDSFAAETASLIEMGRRVLALCDECPMDHRQAMAAIESRNVDQMIAVRDTLSMKYGPNRASAE